MSASTDTVWGRPRWHMTLGVVFTAQLFTSVGFSVVFPFLPLYVKDLGSVTGMGVELMAGLVIGIQGFTMMLVSPLWGAAADRYGRKLMVLRAMFGGTVILALMGVVQNAEQLILLRAVQGTVTGTVAANNALVAGAVPRERIGFSMGMLQVSLWGGVAIGPLLGGVLADAFGFGAPFFVTASALFLSGVLVYFGVEENFTRQDTQADEPRPSMMQQWSHVLNAEGVRLVYGMRFLSDVGRWMIVPIAPLFVVSLLPPDAPNQSVLAGSLIAMSSATATFSGVYLGRLGDRIGHRIILIGAAGAAFAFYIPQVFVMEVWQLLLMQALAGLAIGGLMSAPSALLASYTDTGEEGATYGIDNAITSGARAAAPLIGAGVAAVFGLRGTFAASAVLFLLIFAFSYLYMPQDRVAPQVRHARAAGD